MGARSLREIAVIDEINGTDITTDVVAVDAYNWLYKYMLPVVQYTETSEYVTDDGEELPAVLGLLRGLRRFYEYDVTPIFVFDGSAHSLKSEEIAERRERAADAKEQAHTARQNDDIIAAARAEAKGTRLSPQMVEATQNVLEVADLPYLTAPGAGEAQAAHMAMTDDRIDHVISDDYDALLFGSPSTIRDFTSSAPHEQLKLDSLLTEAGFTREQLIWYAMFCGTDYNDGAHGYGPVKAQEFVLENTSEECKSALIENDESVTSSEAETIYDLFVQPPVTTDYPVMTTLSAVSSTSLQRVVTEQIGLSSETVANSIEKLNDVTPTNAALSDF